MFPMLLLMEMFQKDGARHEKAQSVVIVMQVHGSINAASCLHERQKTIFNLAYWK